MKKSIILQLLLSLSLIADITLTPEQEKSWQIDTAFAKEVSYTPLGEYIISVKTPPNLLHSISVPYEAQVVKLNRVTYERVKKGDSLALLSAAEWIKAQKDVVANSIELIHSKNEAERKTTLCKEEIIAAKECTLADSKVKTDTIKFLTSKAMLKAYGANDKTLESILNESSIFANLEIISPVEGVLTQVNIQTGKSVSPSTAIFVIKKDGENWVEANLAQESIKRLKPLQEVVVTIDSKDIKLKVLHVSPILNSHNQTRLVRFSLPQNDTLLEGLRTKGKLSIEKRAFTVDKKALVQYKNKNIVFIKDGLKYKIQEVDVILEDKDICYISHDAKLEGQIVINGTSVLQNMIQQD